MDSMKRAGEVPVSGAKSPARSSPSASRGDEVPSWADRMELETEALTQPGDEIRPVKVREDTELLLQRAFTQTSQLESKPGREKASVMQN